VPKQQKRTSSPSIASQLRRLGTRKKSRRASAIPPVDGQSSFFMRFSALVAAVVFTVSTSVAVVVPFTVTELVARLHVAGSVVAAGVIAQVRFTVPLNPFCEVTVMVAVFPVVAPGAIVIVVVPPGLPVNVGAEVTVRATVVVAVSNPEVPVMVTVAVPMAAVLSAESVSTLEPVVGLVAKAAVTPLGRPVAARVTLKTKLPTSVTEMVLVPLVPSATESEDGEDESVKPALTVSAMVVDAVSAPDVPVMVTVAGPVAAVAPAESVSTLEPVVGLVAKAAATPLGRPVAARVTLPANPPAGVTVMVSLAPPPCVVESVGADGAIVKLGGGTLALTVRAMEVAAVRAPEVPVMVTVAVPVAAVLLAENVSALEVVAGLVAKVAVTPLGRPLAARVTAPANPFAPVIVMVSAEAVP
jgi:hypothetical protein